MNFWAWALQGTIFGGKSKKGKKPGQFLNPWTSLLPKFLREKLEPDVLAIFTEGRSINCQGSSCQKVPFPFWALVFPKRSYVPPQYPHLQLWFLGQSFAPSLSFVQKSEQQLMIKIIKKINRGLDCFFKKNPGRSFCQRAFAINATPFSFIKNEKGQFYGGGQSVRTFHLHCFLIPANLKKINIPAEKAPLVYPTSFSLELFKLIFSSEKIHKMIFDRKKESFRETGRGVSFNFRGNFGGLIPVLNKIDQLFYRLQLALIFCFYQDGKNFLDKLSDFMTADYLEETKKDRKKLILLGKERNLKEIRILLKRELLNLGKTYGVKFSKKKIDKISELLILDKNGDLSSWVGNQLVVLRPGMGYGTLVRLKNNSFNIHLVPIDSLLPEGTMESSGFIFTDKIQAPKRPLWLEEFKNCLQPLL